MNKFDGVEKAAAAHEAREALGRPQRHNSRANEIEAALTLYLATEKHRERPGSSHAADGAERKRDSDTSS